MRTVTVDQLCARDLGKRVRIETDKGDIAEGMLKRVMSTNDINPRFIIVFGEWFDVTVGIMDLCHISSKTMVDFL